MTAWDRVWDWNMRQQFNLPKCVLDVGIAASPWATRVEGKGIAHERRIVRVVGVEWLMLDYGIKGRAHGPYLFVFGFVVGLLFFDRS